MNVILGELNRAGIEHETLDDVFRLAESIAESCDFFRQPGESRFRVLDLAASLFDHVAAECVGDVIALGVESEDGGSDASAGGLRTDARR
nr:protein UL91 [Mastomys natalensis cytomegalovirus 3]WEG69917.1 protein UL91 [Mastomys natalensis cytomegalovirus 3]WEG70057.1 protein UL91 [Mastomys natalensis cytomegalovirus 3]WEG70197.1 protein UL91 [Mastomys natalensis cytomegalovirus 3]WEG70337.1 protein UL91 [Mastomys natalensis cytomegalovirus 3]